MQKIALPGVKNHAIVGHLETTDYLIIAFYSGKLAIVGADLNLVNLKNLGTTITSINFIKRKQFIAIGLINGRILTLQTNQQL